MGFNLSLLCSSGHGTASLCTPAVGPMHASSEVPSMVTADQGLTQTPFQTLGTILGSAVPFGAAIGNLAGAAADKAVGDLAVQVATHPLEVDQAVKTAENVAGVALASLPGADAVAAVSSYVQGPPAPTGSSSIAIAAAVAALLYALDA